MVVTGPRPDAVAFDHAAAAAAVAALERASAVLADVSAGRIAAGATAREHFRGHVARRFVRADRALGADDADARRGLTVLRAAIVNAAAHARAAQAARVEEQEAWDAAHAAAPRAVGVG